MDEAHKELVKRLQRIQVGMANEEEDAVLAAVAALEAMAGEVATLSASLGQAETERDEFADERDRLKAALEQVKHLSRLRISEREDAIHQTARKALGDAS